MAIHIRQREFIGTLGGLAVTAAATDAHYAPVPRRQSFDAPNQPHYD